MNFARRSTAGPGYCLLCERGTCRAGWDPGALRRGDSPAAESADSDMWSRRFAAWHPPLREAQLHPALPLRGRWQRFVQDLGSEFRAVGLKLHPELGLEIRQDRYG